MFMPSVLLSKIEPRASGGESGNYLGVGKSQVHFPRTLPRGSLVWAIEHICTGAGKDKAMQHMPLCLPCQWQP